MDLSRFRVDPDIARAATPPGAFYSDPELFELSKERVFARSWQIAGDVDRLKAPGQCVPVTLLEGMLDEPLLVVRGTDDELRCFSNVCTHRGTILCESAAIQSGLRCRYHGRRFALDGSFLSMPEFEGVEGFPSADDDLRKVSLGRWGKLLFASLAPRGALAELTAELDRRVGFLPIDDGVLDPGRSREYLVRAHWALYCDNYLEGFHIPYVHQALAGAIDYSRYRVELFARSSLQVGVASEGESVFDLPRDHPDHGEPIAAYYFWLHPNTMLNVYPWGISVNIVKPLGVDRTRVSYLTYVWDAAKLDIGAGAGLDRVEREDEAIVESVQRGLRSRLYTRGRYSVKREQAVHLFHRLLLEDLERA